MFDRSSLLQNFTEALKEMLKMHQSFSKWVEEAGVDLTDAQFNKLSDYLQLLKEKNEVLNLTRITDVREAWIKHILDSLMAAPFFNKPGMKVIDIGTGGGMPGIPLAILFPSAQFTLVDATEKKINAVAEFVRELGLRNVYCLASRIEILGQSPSHREQYDLVLARALAPLPVLIELGVPLIHPYASMIAYKGPEYLSELSSSRNAVTSLRSEQPRVFHYTLPEDMGHRTLIQITKKTVTDKKYPRRDGVPSKTPL